MLRVPVYNYYVFGYQYHRLRINAEGKTIGDVRGSVDYFLDEISELNLRVTAHAADELRDIAGELAEKSADDKVGKALAGRIRAACDSIDRTLDAELQLLGAYSVTPKRFELENLMDTPAALFGRGVFNTLPELCQYDFAEACKCIAFERSTAGAFHLMRGTEGVLRYYYESIVKRGRLKKPMWHPMLAQLRKRRDAPPAAILDHLDNIRANFRNPTQHPEARFEIDDAQDLLAVSIDVTNRIHRDMKRRDPTK